ncbi:hypothetical protein J6590_022375 [Homalodisca vitripennis]|nr:hypothetical protein J6590_022375 [Homalodisca vitripennis]
MSVWGLQKSLPHIPTDPSPVSAASCVDVSKRVTRSRVSTTLGRSHLLLAEGFQHFAISENRVLPWTNPGGLLWDNTGCRDVSGDVVVKYYSYNAVLIVFSMSLGTPSLCSRHSVFTNGPVLSSPHTISHTDIK